MADGTAIAADDPQLQVAPVSSGSTHMSLEARSWQQPALWSLDGTSSLRVCQKSRKCLFLELSSGELLPEGGQFDACGF